MSVYDQCGSGLVGFFCGAVRDWHVSSIGLFLAGIFGVRIEQFVIHLDRKLD